MIFKTIKLALWSLFAAGAYALFRAAMSAPALVESIYSRGVYPYFTKLIGSLTAKTGADIGEIILYILFAFVLGFVIFIIGALFKPKGSKFIHLIRRILGLCITACMIYALFVVCWGLNYARQPLANSLGLTIEQYTSDDLADVCEKLADKANELRSQVKEDENGVFTLTYEKEDMLENVVDEYEKYAPDFMKMCVSSRVKGVKLSALLSRFETQGIFNPFTYEPNVNMDMPDLFFGSTLAHEYAHLQGFAREDEANFISWYVLRNSENADYAYSAYVLALTYGMNELHKTGSSRYAEIYAKICDGIKRDWTNDNVYWDQFDTDFSESATQIYDSYLQSNGVSEGMKSYGRMLDLIIALDKEAQSNAI